MDHATAGRQAGRVKGCGQLIAETRRPLPMKPGQQSQSPPPSTHTTRTPALESRNTRKATNSTKPFRAFRLLSCHSWSKPSTTPISSPVNPYNSYTSASIYLDATFPSSLVPTGCCHHLLDLAPHERQRGVGLLLRPLIQVKAIGILPP